MRLVFFSFQTFLIAVSVESTVIDTQYGPVEGGMKTTENGVTYHSFQGIPYASPPIDSLRFRDAIPPVNWQLPLNCTTEGPPFWGFNDLTGEIQGDFDSLHVNVFTNNLNPQTPYPVMAWIHGGGWQSGSASTNVYGPDYLVEKNVILVTIQYRLSAFGFLSLDDPKLNVPGNQAFKDQRLALKWIQQNIAHFGGDRNQVTLFGQSSGGGSVHYHMISEGSRGLFQRAILMAGTALHNGYSLIPRNNWAQQLASRLNFNSTSESDILNFLQNANPEDIVREQFQLLTFEEMQNQGLAIVFGPTEEPYHTDGVFLNDKIPNMLQNAWGNEVIMLIGAASFEGLDLVPVLREFKEIFDISSNFENFVPRELNVLKGSEESLKYATMLKSTYYGKLNPTVTNIDGLLMAQTDCVLWFPAHRTIRYRIENGNAADTFVYRFDADSEFNVLKALLTGVELYREPKHGEDMTHLFKTILHKPLSEVNEVSRKTLQLMVTSFTNFAKTGNPSIPEMNLNWRAISNESAFWDNGHFLTGINIQENQTEFLTFPESDRMPVFDKIFEMDQNGAKTVLTVTMVKLSFVVFIKNFIL